MHLEKQYPEETWKFWTVPHREDGYESMNPYYISYIQLMNQKWSTNILFVIKTDIIQIGYSSQNELPSNLLHLKDK